MILNNNDNYVITVEELLMRKAKITDNPNFTYVQLFGKNETSDNHYLSGCRLDNKQETENQNFQQGRTLSESENISLNKCPKGESHPQNDQISPNPKFNEELNMLIGKKTGKKFKLGQKVRVKCIAASKESSTIDFALVEGDKNGNSKQKS